MSASPTTMTTSRSYKCTCKYGHDSSRSVVRQIGVRIPLGTGRRVHIQVPWYSDSSYSEQQDTGLTLTSYLSGGFPAGEAGKEWEAGDVGSDDSGMETILDEEEETEQKQETMEKISALESELARLKAQIAVYALSEVSSPPAAPPAPPPPPPPPIALPPHPTSFSTPHHVPVSSRDTKNPLATPVHPNFSHVLHDLGSVKLRSVPSIVRSPGGTPMKKKGQENIEPASNDPAAVIAQALRRKFAHNGFQDSPDKENLDQSSDVSLSEFDSPAGKLFS